MDEKENPKASELAYFWALTKEAAVDAFWDYFYPIRWIYHKVRGSKVE